jgi:cytochrome bd-type quinol oxidase subunit 2
MNDRTNTAPTTAPTTAASAALDDLAFVRNLVEQGSRGQLTGGSIFFAGGMLYGLQTLYHYAQFKGWIDPPAVVSLIVVAGVTIAFLATLTVVLWRDRKAGTAGLMSRALTAVFGGIGLANLAMVFVFGVNAARTGVLTWMLYPPVIFALQGAAWYAAYQLQKRSWHAVVAFGWLIAAAALGYAVGNTELYVLIASLSLFGLMALPGFVMMRLARQNA